MPPTQFPLEIRPAEGSDLGFIRQLLVDQFLPAGDLITSPIDFLVALDADENIKGCIGMEVYGENGFVRSFSVQENIKNTGIGSALLERLMEVSKSKGIRNLHLLTTTAETYFQKKGFIKTDRKDAPESIKQTTEFKGMCVSSAIYMVKTN
ncbi:MAG: arsenic resistance N-acetyltransferase ArsN2 [Saprospiraceae bacterium]